ncbi:unnamed protein product [Trichobilharzia regenti]|nr:unnamed protein product [Trichobilharzia regenti]
MWPLILQFIRSNIAYVALPFAAVVGFVGYNAESWLRSPEAISSSRHNPKQTISEARTERQLARNLSSSEGPQSVSPDSELQYRSSPIFDKNK